MMHVGIIYYHFKVLNHSRLTLSQFSGLVVRGYNRLINDRQELHWTLEPTDQPLVAEKE
jgi:hypothetical protein